jgi:hypothetical protein
MRHLIRSTIAAIITSTMMPVLAFANDGFMGLPAGGLTLQQSADIRMLDEDLFLSLDEVRVAYQFRNDSKSAIKALVGFPMPGLPVSVNFDGEDGYDIHDIKTLELLKFETRVEGKIIQSQPVVRAYFFPKDMPWEKQDRFRFTDAIDITAELQSAGVPLNFDAKAIKNAFARLPAAKQVDWKRRGLYTKDPNFERPSWWLSTIYMREQIFPAGAILRVQHRYKPYPSGFVMVPDHFKYDKELAKSTCVDAPTMKAITRLLAPQQGGSGHVIDYILTTANTWKGPIGHFRLTVDKGVPQNIVSLCGDGVRKTGPKTFTLETRNFSPKQDIKVLIVKSPQYN